MCVCFVFVFFSPGALFSWKYSDKSFHEHYSAILHHIRVGMKPTSWRLPTPTTTEHQPSTEQEGSLGGCSSPDRQQGFPRPTPRHTDEGAASSLQKTNTFRGPMSPSRVIHLRARTSSRLRMSQKDGGRGGYSWSVTLCL